MKRILLGIMTIALVSGVSFGATRAFFTDTETNTGNTFAAGTIDIAVDNNNPWVRTGYQLTDMKPSNVGYIDFTVHNVGTNPVNLFKTLKNFAFFDDKQSEPECVAENGTWDNDTCTGQGKPENDVSKVINYDLRVELYNVAPDGNVKPVWWETIYQDSDGVKLNSLTNPIYLGMIPADWYLKVSQSYHMPGESTGNEYQGDKLTFDIQLDAEQLTNTVRLENKYLVNTDVSHHVWLSSGASDGKDATLTYGVKDKKFDYTLKVEGMANGPYTLVAWEDPTYVWSWGNFAGTTVLANVNVAGITNVTGSLNLGKDLKNAKVWLVPGTLDIPGATGVILPWDPVNTLFETGLIDYYDSGI